MVNRSKIAWTDFSGGDLNFVTGCTPVSEGCQHCYARRISQRFDQDWTPTIHPDKLRRLWKMAMPAEGNKRGTSCRPMAFVVDTGDLFHDDVPAGFIFTALDMMAARNDVVWQILTKRPSRMSRLITTWTGGQPMPDNIWLGVTAENQQRADERVPLLLQTPAAVRFVSCEPLLESVDLQRYLLGAKKLDWVICGGESGPDARAMAEDWARSLRDQCQEAQVAYFFKQHSGTRPGMIPLLDGVEYHQWPRM